MSTRAHYVVPRLFAVAMALMLALLVAVPASTSAAPTTVGYKDFAYEPAPSISDPSQDKPQSKVWYNDGWWWAGLFNVSDEKYHIYRLDLASHTWIDTNVVIDDRNSSQADYLWDGTSLYVASINDAGAIKIFHLTYNVSTNSYAHDPAFTVAGVAGVDVGTGIESVTLAKDSTGRLWIAFPQADTVDPLKRNIMVNRSTGPESTWGAPFVVPGQPNAVSDDDIAAIIAFEGNKIGVMWSDQVGDGTTTSFHFATHLDADADTTWPAPLTTAASGGSLFANDHINMKLATTGSGRVLAVVKTSVDSDNVLLLERNVSTEAWNSYPVFSDPGDHSRPQLVVNDEQGVAYVFATSDDGGGDIVYKSAPLSNLASISSAATGTFLDAGAELVNNVSTTKQNVNSETGILGIAADDNEYFHNYLPLATTPFTDIGGTFFEDVIIWLYDQGITTGCTATTFCPTATVTREQMAAFINRAAPLPPASQDYFTDDEDSFAEDDINRLAEAGITTGCTATTFCPKQTVTREQMAAFLDRALNLPDTGSDFFTDDESSFAEQNINNIAAFGITTGCTATTYCPSQNVTREQMAAFLHRAFTGV